MEEAEKIEFLGDAVLSFALTSELFEKFGTEPVGVLASAKAALASKAFLARKAREIGLHSLFSAPEIIGERDDLLADFLEILLGILYLDQGFPATKKWILRLYQNDFIPALLGKFRDVKGLLQEILYYEFRKFPVYRTVKKVDAFNSSVYLGRIRLGTGKGKIKKTAEIQAARSALLHTSDWYRKLMLRASR